jgi:NAD(P)H-flavin reductase
MVPEVRTVLATRPETADTATLTVSGPTGPGPAPRPGQFWMLGAFGVGEVPISASALLADGSTEHTIRAVGPVTAALVATGVGAAIGARGPFGRGWDPAAAEGGDVVVVAGGIGLAPLKPLVEAILARRDRYRRVSVLVGARTPADVCLAADLARWAARGDVHVAATVDRRQGEGAEGWTGRVGVVTTLLPATRFDPGSTTAFVCGPEVMMRATARALADRGVDLADQQLSAERSMTCGVALCGHCQLGPVLVCRDGPVLPATELLPLMEVRER